MAMKRGNAIKAMVVALTLTGATWAPPAACGQTLTAQASAQEGVAAGQLIPREIYRKLLPSTCWILAPVGVGSETGISSGTGWVADAQRRLIVTNDHVVKGADSVLVFFPAVNDGRVVKDMDFYKAVKPISGTVIDCSPQRDLALIQLESLPTTAPTLTLAIEDPEPGEKVYTVAAWANGSGGLWDFTSGSVRQICREKLANSPSANSPVACVVETDLPCDGGNSGGAIVNDRCEVVAVVEGYNSEARLVSLSIALSEVRDYLAECDRLVEPITEHDFLARGNRRLTAGRLNLAIHDFTEALNIDRFLVMARIDRGLAFFQKGDYPTALADFNEAVNQKPDQVAYFCRGVCYRELRQYPESIADLTQAISRNPDEANEAKLYDSRAIAYFRAGQLGRCLSDLNRAIQMGPDDVAIRGHRVEVYRVLKRFKEAAADLEVCIKIQPQNPEWLFQLGWIYIDMKDYEAGVTCNSLAIQMNDRDLRFYNNRGMAYLGLNRLDEAFQDFKKAIELKPDCAQYYHNAGLALLQARAYREAIECFSKAIELDGADAPSYWRRGDCHAALGNWAAAEADRQKTAELTGQR
jgi:tetratricopeptide (TPR) repeat protein